MQVEPAGREGLLEHPRHRDQRRARVPREAAVAELRRRARRARGRCSTTTTSWPAPCSRSAAASPPRPAPTTTTLTVPPAGAPGPSAAAARRAGRPGGDPQLLDHRADRLVARGRPGRRRGTAAPGRPRVAPSARHFATSTPSRSPPEAMTGSPGRGRARLRERVGGRQPPVGERGGDGACARVAAALDEGPVRAARAGDVDGRDAGVAQQRHVRRRRGRSRPP